ncbi:MAG: hypothetical protein V4795_05750 [Pseudomonadota bacterium]
MPPARLVHLAVRCALLLAAAQPLQPALAQAAAGPVDDRGCAVSWQVRPVLVGTDTTPPHLHLTLRFQAGRRSQTALHLPGGWAGLTELPEADGPRLRALPGEPAWRSLVHAPGEMVQLQWRLQPPADASQGGHAQLTPDWFAFSGQGVLPMPEGADDAGAGPACVVLSGLPAGSRWASSHGTADGPGARFVLPQAGVPLAQRVQQALYAGGALQLQAAPGVVAALPQAAPWPVSAAAVASAGARALAAQQRQWPQPAGREADSPSPPWLLLVLPAPAAAPLASAWHQALALQLPPGWAGGEPALERQLTPALARAWMADRFGPLAHAGRGDAPLRAWFSAGWADFLAHRSLLRDGLWTAEDYAAALNARIAADVAEPARNLPNAELAAQGALAPRLALLQARRGEWLALHWHQALRRAGHPGLDAVLRQQLVPAAQARREGPISAPLATHRVVATLRGVLHDQVLRELQQHIDQGLPLAFGPDSLGPCFAPAPGAGHDAAPAYRAVPGALQQADCQGWLGLGPLAETAALPRAQARADPAARAGSRQAARKGGGKATAKAGARRAATATGKAATGKSTKPTKPKAPSRSKAGKPAR